MSKPNSKYPWDKFSDQPHILRDKKFKKSLYKIGAAGSLKTFLSALLLPWFAIRLLFQPRTIMGKPSNNIGLCVNPDYPLPEKYNPTNSQLYDLVNELCVENLLIRIPLSDWKHKQKYFDFIALFSGKKLLINILQDREHIEDPKSTTVALREIFQRFGDVAEYFQIGNTVNRRKWAFVSQDEYFDFFKVAQTLKETEFPKVQLLGGNVIDFELPYYIRSLIHGKSIKYDGVAAQLYVDRRGAPENTQMSCDLIAKINWFDRILRSSNKSLHNLFITEVNWPLEGMRPFAPAWGKCMVSETLQTTYLVRYFLLMMASGRVEKCYWHQLVAPGYGLVDNLGTELRKRDAYQSFKVMNQLLNDATTVSYSEKDNAYQFSLKSPRGNICAVWGNGKSFEVSVGKNTNVIDLLGEPITPDSNGEVTASDQVIYLLDFKF